MAPEQDAQKNSSRSGRVKEDRLSKENWLEAGLKILGQTGPGGIRIDQVCKAMNVTKGSFYWHFQDRQDFLDSLFAYWRGRETTGLIRHVEEHFKRPEDRIWYVLEFVTLGTFDVVTEVAMRQWSQNSEIVHAGLSEVDAERLAFFSRQFAQMGFEGEEARMRAATMYSVTLSFGFMITGESHDELERRIRASYELLLTR